MNSTRGWITFVHFAKNHTEAERFSCWQIGMKSFYKAIYTSLLCVEVGSKANSGIMLKMKQSAYKGIKSHPISNSSYYLLCECEHTENNLRKIPQLNKSWHQGEEEFPTSAVGEAEKPAGRRNENFWPDVDESQTKQLAFTIAKNTISGSITLWTHWHNVSFIKTDFFFFISAFFS